MNVPYQGAAPAAQAVLGRALPEVFSEVMAEPETQERFRKMGSIPLHASQDAFGKTIREEVQMWGKRPAEYDIRPIR